MGFHSLSFLKLLTLFIWKIKLRSTVWSSITPQTAKNKSCHYHSTLSPYCQVFSRKSDSRDSVVLDGCSYVKSQVWLCSKRCGYVKDGVVMLKKVWLCCHQNLNTPFISQTVNGVAGVVMLKMVWLCSSISQLSHQLTFSSINFLINQFSYQSTFSSIDFLINQLSHQSTLFIFSSTYCNF